jgi:hypothetical protein
MKRICNPFEANKIGFSAWFNEIVRIIDFTCKIGLENVAKLRVIFAQYIRSFFCLIFAYWLRILYEHLSSLPAVVKANKAERKSPAPLSVAPISVENRSPSYIKRRHSLLILVLLPPT